MSAVAMVSALGRLSEAFTLIVAGGEDKARSLGIACNRGVDCCTRVGCVEGGGVMLAERGGGDAKPAFSWERVVDASPPEVWGGGVDGIWMLVLRSASDLGSVLLLAIVSQQTAYRRE